MGPSILFPISQFIIVVRCLDGANAATLWTFSRLSRRGKVGERKRASDIKATMTRRQIALPEMENEHETMSADIDEKAIRSDDPKSVEALAKAKAEALKRLSKEEKDGGKEENAVNHVRSSGGF